MTRNTKDRAFVGITMPLDDRDMLTAICERHERTVTNMVTVLIRKEYRTLFNEVAENERIV